jgi:anti-sigma factor RsiW
MTEPSSPDCTALLASISAYLDGELEAVECAAIERHCYGCPRCAALVEGLRHTIGLCRDVGTAPLPEPVRQRARESVRRLLDTAERAPSE